MACPVSTDTTISYFSDGARRRFCLGWGRFTLRSDMMISFQTRATRRLVAGCFLSLLSREVRCKTEHWLATLLNDYLRDKDEYRAITRNRSTPADRSPTARRPSPSPSRRSPRLTRGLALLLKEINAAPPLDPGLPSVHQLSAHDTARPDLTTIKDRIPEV